MSRSLALAVLVAGAACVACGTSDAPETAPDPGAATTSAERARALTCEKVTEASFDQPMGATTAFSTPAAALEAYAIDGLEVEVVGSNGYYYRADALRSTARAQQVGSKTWAVVEMQTCQP